MDEFKKVRTAVDAKRGSDSPLDDMDPLHMQTSFDRNLNAFRWTKLSINCVVHWKRRRNKYSSCTRNLFL